MDHGGMDMGSGSTLASQLAQLLTPPADAVAGAGPTTGDDVMIYADTDDRGNGGIGNDLLIGLAGDDSLSGGWGDDRIDAGDGDDHIHGGHGDDLVYGGDGDDDMTGDFGDDILLGGAGGDELRGNRGEDVLFGGEGDDVLIGGVGDDIFMGGVGEDSINGGAGEDALLLTGTIADYTVAVDGNTVQFTDAAGETDIVQRVEAFRFLGNGETYALEDGNLVLSAETADLDDLLEDHFIEELIAAETGTDDAAAAPDASDAAAAASTATDAAVTDADLLAA
jgi:Ca2+-binding RTX toxin-like protein